MWAVQSADSGWGRDRRPAHPGIAPSAARGSIARCGCGGGGYGWRRGGGRGGELRRAHRLRAIAAIRRNPTPRRSRRGTRLQLRRSLRPACQRLRVCHSFERSRLPDRPRRAINAPPGCERAAAATTSRLGERRSGPALVGKGGRYSAAVQSATMPAALRGRSGDTGLPMADSQRSGKMTAGFGRAEPVDA